MKPWVKIFIIAFFIRIIPFTYAAFNNPEGFLLYDSYGYLNLADNLLEHQIFSRASENESLMPDASRTPSFPIFIASIKLFSNNNALIVFFILLLGSLNASLTYKVCKQLFDDHKIAFLSAILVAIDIPSIYFSNIIMSETLFTTLLLLSILILLEKQTNKSLMISGILISLAILCRPIAILFPILIFSFYILNKRMNIRSALLYLFTSYILVFGWMYRNDNTFGSVFLSSISSINIYFYTNAAITSEVENISFDKAQQQLSNELKTALDWHNDQTDVAPMIKYCNSYTFNNIKSHPLIFIKQTTIGIIYFFTKPLRSYLDSFIGFKDEYDPISGKNTINNKLEALQNNSVITIILVVFQVFISILMLIALGATLFSRNFGFNTILILIIIGYFAILSSITEVDGRFRIPIIPFLAILLSNTIYKTVLKLKNRNSTIS